MYKYQPKKVATLTKTPLRFSGFNTACGRTLLWLAPTEPGQLLAVIWRHLGPFTGRVKQAIAKERHSPACENLMNSPKRTERYLLLTDRIKRFLQASFVGGRWVEGMGWGPHDQSRSSFFFWPTRVYCSCLMTIFRAPTSLFRQHFEGPRLFCCRVSLFFLSFGIKY